MSGSVTDMSLITSMSCLLTSHCAVWRGSPLHSFWIFFVMSAIFSTSTWLHSVLRNDWNVSSANCTWSQTVLSQSRSCRHFLISRKGVIWTSKSSHCCESSTALFSIVVIVAFHSLSNE